MLELEMDKRTSGECAADALRAEILSGRIAPGTELSQVEIANSLGLSRMPVREALMQLESEGFVERLDNRHTRVTGADRASRFALLAALMELAASALRPEQTKRLLDWRQHCTRDKGALLALHQRIVNQCPDRFLALTYRRIFLGFFQYCVGSAAALPPDAMMDLAMERAAAGDGAGFRQALSRYYAQLDAAQKEG